MARTKPQNYVFVVHRAHTVTTVYVRSVQTTLIKQNMDKPVVIIVQPLGCTIRRQHRANITTLANLVTQETLVRYALLDRFALCFNRIVQLVQDIQFKMETSVLNAQRLRFQKIIFALIVALESFELPEKRAMGVWLANTEFLWVSVNCARPVNIKTKPARHRAKIVQVVDSVRHLEDRGVPNAPEVLVRVKGR